MVPAFGHPVSGRCQPGHREAGPNRLQFIAMQACEVFQRLSALGGQVHFDAPPVAPTREAVNPARRFAPGDERYDAMVLGLQTLGELGHCRPLAIRKAPDLQHECVLKRRHAMSLRRLLAEAHEATQLVAKGSEGLEIDL